MSEPEAKRRTIQANVVTLTRLSSTSAGLKHSEVPSELIDWSSEGASFSAPTASRCFFVAYHWIMDRFWQLPPFEVNRHLHALFGKYRVIVSGAAIRGIGIPVLR